MKKTAVIDRSRCVGCGCCIKVCPLGAVSVPKGIFAVIDTEKCVGCGRCSKECPASIITIVRREEPLGDSGENNGSGGEVAYHG